MRFVVCYALLWNCLTVVIVQALHIVSNIAQDAHLSDANSDKLIDLSQVILSLFNFLIFGWNIVYCPYTHNKETYCFQESMYFS